MMITVVALMCHTVAAVPAAPLCHEEIIVQDDMPMQSCLIAQPAIADWKMKSKYQGDQWHIARIRCIPGDYVVKDAI